MAAKSEKLLIGPRIKRFRKALGLTQSRMAEAKDASISVVIARCIGRRSATCRYCIGTQPDQPERRGRSRCVMRANVWVSARSDKWID